ncbi:MAG: triose-phosphate isomerase [Rhodobacteraceae bacterium]|nr:triose-phosphate isomerase [Paracoccaceae bacterium]
MPAKLAAGNWKMNGTGAALTEIEALQSSHPAPGCDVLICPPATLIARMADMTSGSAIAVGGQDCHAAAGGAHTGDIAATMLTDAGASHVILGHSERRADHGESSADVLAKAVAATEAGLVAIICIGETLEEREAGRTLEVVLGQLEASTPDASSAETVVIAYEPVWAIGTGKVATLEQIAEVHAAIRDALAGRFGDGGDFSILYGGSVKPSNAAEIFGVANVDGALVGGASLKAADFSGIITALEASGG